jgi:hypothetical protein
MAASSTTHSAARSCSSGVVGHTYATAVTMSAYLRIACCLISPHAWAYSQTVSAAAALRVQAPCMCGHGGPPSSLPTRASASPCPARSARAPGALALAPRIGGYILGGPAAAAAAEQRLLQHGRLGRARRAQALGRSRRRQRRQLQAAGDQQRARHALRLAPSVGQHKRVRVHGPRVRHLRGAMPVGPTIPYPNLDLLCKA